jgi:hypothetical protein
MVHEMMSSSRGVGLFGGRYAGGCWLPLCVKSRAIVQDILTSIGTIVFY